jgi:hypothetical protein
MVASKEDGSMRRAIQAAAAIVGVGLAAAAVGDWVNSWSSFSGRSFSPTFTRGDIGAVVRVLGLDEAEATVVQDLHEAYAARVRDEGRAVRREVAGLIEEAELMSRSEVAREVQGLRDEWEERRVALEGEFLEELRLTLTREQDVRWPLVERELRRIHELPAGRMRGESVDVIRLAEVAGVEAEGAVAAALDRYSRALDGLLRTRAKELERNTMEEVLTLIETDARAAKRAFEGVRDARVEIRDLNLEAVREVVAAAPPEAGERLWWSYLEQTLSRVVTETVAERMLANAAKVPSLTDAQIDRLASIRERYEASRWEWMDRMRGVVFEIEEEAVPEAIAVALGEAPTRVRPESEPGPTPEWLEGSAFRKAWTDRLRMDRALRGELESLLTEAQWVELPVSIDQGIRFRGGQLYNVASSGGGGLDL